MLPSRGDEAPAEAPSTCILRLLACLLLAQSGDDDRTQQCPLSGVKRTLRGHCADIAECLLLTQSGNSILRIVATLNDVEPHSAGCKSLL
jgi:hypothetical protein